MTPRVDTLLSGIRFSLSAALAYGTTVALYHLSAEVLPQSDGLRYAIVQVLVLSLNFSVARYWIFRGSDGAVRAQFFSFLLVAVCVRSLDWAIFSTLSASTSLASSLAILLSMGVVLPLKFLVYKRIVFV